MNAKATMQKRREYFTRKDPDGLWHWCIHLPNGTVWKSSVGYVREISASQAAESYGHVRKGKKK